MKTARILTIAGKAIWALCAIAVVAIIGYGAVAGLSPKDIFKYVLGVSVLIALPLRVAVFLWEDALQACDGKLSRMVQGGLAFMFGGISLGCGGLLWLNEWVKIAGIVMTAAGGLFALGAITAYLADDRPDGRRNRRKSDSGRKK